MPAKKNGVSPFSEIGKNATFKEIVAAARKFMTPEELRDFTRVKKEDKNGGIPILHVRKGATMKEIYAAARRAFTAADLQKYTRDEPMVPAEEILKDMEEIHRFISAKLAKHRKRNRKKAS